MMMMKMKIKTKIMMINFKTNKQTMMKMKMLNLLVANQITTINKIILQKFHKKIKCPKIQPHSLHNYTEKLPLSLSVKETSQKE